MRASKLTFFLVLTLDPCIYIDAYRIYNGALLFLRFAILYETLADAVYYFEWRSQVRQGAGRRGVRVCRH